VLLSLADIGLSRTYRMLLVICGLAIYALFCLGLARYGYLEITGLGFTLLFGSWIGGFLLLLFADETRGRFDPGTLTFSKALWLNLGVVVTAALVPHVLRLLLLALPLLRIVYASLHLERQPMLTVAGVTWVSYLVSSVLLVLLHSADPVFEGLIAVAFTCMLRAKLATSSL